MSPKKAKPVPLRRENKLDGVHPDLIKVVKKAAEKYNFVVLEGVRSIERQQELFDTGKSKTMDSKHLLQQDGYGHAVDLAPDPTDWNDREQFVALGFFVQGIAYEMGIELRLGTDWDGDLNIKEHSFFDGPHMELKL